MKTRTLPWLAVITVLWFAIARNPGGAGEIAFPEPAVDAQLAAERAEESIVLAGGCFWGVQAVFQHVKGVSAATSGYAGGSAKSASVARSARPERRAASPSTSPSNASLTDDRFFRLRR